MRKRSRKIKQLTAYALHGIGRGGQRILLAVLAVAFGVMSLVAMTTLSEAIFDVLLIDPRYGIGADAQLWRGETAFLSDEELAQIEGLARGGAFERWAAVSNQGQLLLKTPDSGRVTFLRGGVGAEPGSYPLFGEIRLSDPAGAGLEDVLKQPGDAVVTRDIADERSLALGDTILAVSQFGGAGEPLRVAGIAASTPSFHGGTLYYDLNTAARLAGRQNPVTDVYVLRNAGSEAALEALEESGWKVYSPDHLDRQTLQIRTTLNLMLRGAAILGLMVGGIGITNTMQVVLARRREEVAVLKTLGYARRDILLMFAIETALIGLAGSFLGAVVGVGLSTILVKITGNIITLFMTWRFNPALTFGGIAAGVLTTVLFAANAILRASDVRPADVFRQLPPPPYTRLRSLAVFGLMAVPFGAMAVLVMGSWWQGAAVLAAALAGFLVIGGALAGLKRLALRLLPTFGQPLLGMARNNLRRRGGSLVFAMIALAAGTFTLGLSVIIIHGSVDQFKARMLSQEGYNLVVLAEPEGAERAERRLAEVSQNTGVRYEAPLEAAQTAAGEDLSKGLNRPILQGRAALWDLSVEGAAWGTAPEGAYLPAEMGIPAGERVIVTVPGGAQTSLTVAGAYAAKGEWDRMLLPAPAGILVSADMLKTLGGEQAYALAAGEVPPGQMEALADRIGEALPETVVITASDLNDSFNETFLNLFFFAVAMAGLALLAGAVLIANAVSLAMIERRYEIGILKATGFTRRQVLASLMLEYGLVSAIASFIGLIGVLAFLFFLGQVERLELAANVLVTGPLLNLLIVVAAVGLTLLAALAAAWGPTAVRPLVLLNESG